MATYLSPGKLASLIEAMDGTLDSLPSATTSMEAAIREVCRNLGFNPDETRIAVDLYVNGDEDSLSPTATPPGYVKTTYRAPIRKSVELPGGRFYSREWEKGEKSVYERTVLIRKA